MSVTDKWAWSNGEIMLKGGNWTGGKEKLDSVPLRLPQMTKASTDLICHTREDGRHCLRRKGTKICDGVCGYCQPNCRHSRIKVNERTPCIQRLCLRTCLMLNTLYTSAVPQNVSHVEHPVYISCASEHVSCWTLYTSAVPQNMSHVEHLYTSAVPQNMSHVEHPV